MALEQAGEESNSSAGRRVSNKRKRETPASRIAAKSSKSSTPNAYARRTPPPEPAPIADDDEEAPRQLKRPGAASRITAADRDAAERFRRQREEEARNNVVKADVTGTAAIADHYNAVPERGRQWRQSDSRIKGLRSLNNWIKSTLIQKFSRPEIPTAALHVLDMACGKGGDLGKWEKAPQVPVLYVGCDIANVSIEQARERYTQSQRNNARYRRGPPMRAEFYVHDAFGRPLSDVPAVQAVGFNPGAGPGGGVIQGGMRSGNFDVVSMMFALHYSFESEELARGMLKNVAGALKKGGRFIGVMPDSDVISTQVRRLLVAEGPDNTASNGRNTAEPRVNAGEDGDADEDDWDPEKPSDAMPSAKDDDDWDPEKPSEVNIPDGGDGDDWDPELPSEPMAAPKADGLPNTTSNTLNSAVDREADDGSRSPLAWGNDIYNIRFPRQQRLTKRSLPRDGIFRPPFGWRYNYTLEEAVNQPEYVVPWEAFRALAEEYGLELMYRKNFRDVLHDEVSDRELGMLAERMNVLRGGKPLVTGEEMEAASFYHAFCFYKT